MALTGADLQQLLIRGLDLQGDQLGAFLGRVTPVILLDDLSDFESSQAFVNRPCAGSVAAVGAAAEFPAIALRNPPNSGVDITTEFVVVSSSLGPATFRIGIPTTFTGFTEQTVSAFTDRRIAGSPAGELWIDSVAPAPTLSGVFHTVRVAANAPIFLPLRCLLSPIVGALIRNTVMVTIDAAVSTITVGFGWKESRTSTLTQ